MAIHYSVIEIFTNEQARIDRKPAAAAVLEWARSLKIGARCMVFKGTDAIYEDGEQATRNVLALSYNMPVKIEILLPTSEVDNVLPQICRKMTDGLVALRDLDVRAFRKPHQLIPRHLRVEDIMTPSPVTVPLSMTVAEIVRILVGEVFGGVPVVDARQRPVGMITQHDLIYKAGLGLRLGLLANADPHMTDQVLAAMQVKNAGDIMTAPAVCADIGKPVFEVARLMIRDNLKRLPVVKPDGQIAGMISRLDIFQTITEFASAWDFLRNQNVDVDDVRRVSDIMLREIRTVLPETALADLLRMIDSRKIQSVAVTDTAGRFLGMVFDADVLAAFVRRSGAGKPTFRGWEWLLREGAPAPDDRSGMLLSMTAADLMRTNLHTVPENMLIEDAIRLMVEKRIKRLPVTDATGVFKGMVSREQLFRIGFDDLSRDRQ